MIKKKKDIKFSRYKIFFIAMIVIFSAIVSRLLYLQVVMADEYREEASQKHFKNVAKVAPRGDIKDKNGEILATSIQCYTLMFSETTESKEKFENTMNKVFKKLDENKVSIEDEFPISVDLKEKNGHEEIYNINFKFKGTNKDRLWMELRFKKDRGFDEIVRKKLYKDKNDEELTDSEKKEIDDAVLKISAEDVLKELLKQYQLDKKEYDKYNLIEKRKFLVVLDAMKMQSYSGYKPVEVATNLSKEVAFIFEQLQPDLPGIIVETKPMRYYPNKELGSAFLGYTSKIASWQKDKYEERGYDVSTDIIGTAGIESSLESELKGTKGQESIEVNKQGRKVKTLGEVEAYPGKDIYLNIDNKVQAVTEKSLDDTMEKLRSSGEHAGGGGLTNPRNATRGAAVVMEAKTGKILALASRPGYDPNIFVTPGLLTDELSSEYFSPNLEKKGREYIEKFELANVSGVLSDEEVITLSYDDRVNILMERIFPKDDNGNREDKYDIFPKPLYNYATLTLTPPGSIFKPLVAVAGLEEGVIDPYTTIYDNGEYNKRYDTYKGSCWIYKDNHGTHGDVDVKKALEVSCNYFFYDVADRLFERGNKVSEGLDYIAKYGWKFGLGVEPGSGKEASTGIEIDEHFGQVYNYESSKNKFANENIDKLATLMNNGNNSLGDMQYKGIDITRKKEIGIDKEKISMLNKKKTDLIDYIKEEMKKEKKSPEEEITKTTEGLLKNMINDSTELKQKGYTEKDINGMTVAINYSITDCISNRKSAANAYDASIGQGMNNFTPLQLTNYVATLVNGGNRYEMQLVNKIVDSVTGEETVSKPKLLEKIEMNDENVEAIKEGMFRATRGEQGTGATAFEGFPTEIGIAGKTGSSTFNQEKQDALGRTSYATYVGFAPYNDPEIVVSVIVFDGGHGGNVAEVARNVYEQYFSKEILKINPNYQFRYPELIKSEGKIDKSETEKKTINENVEKIENKAKTNSIVDEE